MKKLKFAKPSSASAGYWTWRNIHMSSLFRTPFSFQYIGHYILQTVAPSSFTAARQTPFSSTLDSTATRPAPTATWSPLPRGPGRSCPGVHFEFDTTCISPFNLEYKLWNIFRKTAERCLRLLEKEESIRTLDLTGKQEAYKVFCFKTCDADSFKQ